MSYYSCCDGLMEHFKDKQFILLQTTIVRKVPGKGYALKMFYGKEKMLQRVGEDENNLCGLHTSFF